MHIPDGYLSPATCVAFYAASAPFWYVAAQRTKRFLTGRMVPLLSLLSAFTFVIMLFNIPLPGGTTGHAVGGTLLAVVLGPWPALLGVTVALVIQALLFGDGGITALGANSFNMAIVLPMVGYYTYRLISRNAPVTSSRHVVGAAIGAYLGLNAAALLTALELGMQPLLFHSADGTPLYAPYGLGVALPVMMGSHLLVAGVLEALITGLVIAYLQRAHQPLLSLREKWEGTHSIRALWIALGALILMAPLGLLASGVAWGEWSADELEQQLGFVPAGLAALSNLWSAPLPDYSIAGIDASLGYVLLAVVGVGFAALITWGLGRMLARP
ncbi:MAG: cobalt transporter CbiM [Bacteroidetes bacterium]|nr:cobalt transporter CbiM [Bacteroidota bacterium]MCL5026902.1 cobalt transporter CbiM [Chloroflexota bacterium]